MANAERITPQDRLHENAQKVREAGYNVKCGNAIVFVNGVPVARHLFTELHWAVLLPLIDMIIGLHAAQCGKAC